MSRQSKAALAAILGALAGLGTLVGVVYALRDDDGEGSAREPALETGPAETGSTGELLPTVEEPVELTRTIEVGGFPNAVAVGRGSVWVVRDGRRLYRIDPDTGTVQARIGAGDELGSLRPCGVAVDRAGTWVTTVSGDLARINRRDRLGRLIDLEDAACVATGAGGVWVTSPNLNTVTRLDAETNEVVAQIPVDGFPQGIGIGFRAVWVASADPPDGAGGAVYRIDPQTNEVVAAIPVDDLPEFLAVGAGGVWVTSNNGTVKLIEPSTNRLVDPPARVAEAGRTSVAVGGGFVWATTIDAEDGPGSVVQIDPETSEVIGPPIPVGQNPLGLAFGAGSLWVANYSEGTLTAYTPG